MFTGRLSTDLQPWTRDHVVLGVTIVPGTGLVDMALTAGGQVGSPVLAELTLQAPLVLEEGGTPDPGDGRNGRRRRAPRGRRPVRRGIRRRGRVRAGLPRARCPRRGIGG
ncbi:hypothetical protein ACFQ0M_34435 [Kitasatospora aburaviensis]